MQQMTARARAHYNCFLWLLYHGVKSPAAARFRAHLLDGYYYSRAYSHSSSEGLLIGVRYLQIPSRGFLYRFKVAESCLNFGEDCFSAFWPEQVRFVRYEITPERFQVIERAKRPRPGEEPVWMPCSHKSLRD